MRHLENLIRASGRASLRLLLIVCASALLCTAARAAEVNSAAPHEHQLQASHHMVVVVYCLAIVLASVFGGFLPKLMTLTHGRLQMLISYVGGLMLGISVFHLLPHAMVELGGARVDAAMIALMCGMVAMFLLLRMFHFHDHGTAEVPDAHDHDHDGGVCHDSIVSLEAAYSGTSHSVPAGRSRPPSS